jgi:outer membrane protein assembly factor BamB
MNSSAWIIPVLAGAGLAAAQPHIDDLAAHTLPRSGRLVIHGTGFGEQDYGEVLVDGIDAWTTTWSDTRIVAYVPEDAALGDVPVQVNIWPYESNAVSLEVTERPPPGRVLWTFEADVSNLWYRPAVADDGTIYLHGSKGKVFALTPDGALLWTAKARGYPQTPPSSAPDGLYLGSLSWISKFRRDGALAWEFEDAGAQTVQAAPTVGPDGNVYAAFDLGFGAVSLNPDGWLLWTNTGDPFTYQYGGDGTEIKFGPSTPGGPIDQFYFGMDRGEDDRLYAFSLIGQQRFAIPLLGGSAVEPVVGSDGTIYVGHGAILAFDPGDGTLLWSEGGDAGHLDIGPGDILYYSTNDGLEAFDPHVRAVLWRHDVGDGLARPSVSPDGSVVVAGGSLGYFEPCFIRGVDGATGEELWMFELPFQYPGVRVATVHHPRFTPDSRVVYVSTLAVSEEQGDPHTLFYAIAADETPTDCYADLDASGLLDLFDFLAFANLFNAADAGADCDGNGILDLFDFLCFVNAFNEGC